MRKKVKHQLSPQEIKGEKHDNAAVYDSIGLHDIFIRRHTWRPLVIRYV